MPTIENLNQQFLVLTTKYSFWSRITEFTGTIHSIITGAIIAAILLNARPATFYLYIAFVLLLAFHIEVAKRRKNRYWLAMLMFLDENKNYHPMGL